MSRPSPTPPARVTLRRELGRWDLTAIGVNQVIGGALFAQPSLYAASVGAWSPWLVAATGFASLLIALSFAEVSSRFDATGGPYLYTRAAFGRFAAFEMGWMLWFTRAASWAAVINVLATSLAFYAPVLGSGWARGGFITLVIATLAAINIRGIRQSSLVLNTLTIGKLVPLAAFVAIGIFFIEPARLSPQGVPTMAELSATGLLLIFAFGGYEVVPVPAGEARDPRRAVPFALVMTIVIVTLLMTLVQVVALGYFSRPRGVEDSAHRRVPALHGRVRSHSPHDWRRLFDNRQQHGAGALRFAQPLRARRAGGLATSVCLDPSAISHASECNHFYVCDRARPCRVREIFGPGAGERHQPAARLCWDLCRHAASAVAAVVPGR